MPETLSVFRTTLDQLTHAPESSGQGVNRLRAMVGAHQFAATQLDNGDVLSEFAFKLFRRFNRCQITYHAGPDEYSLRLARVKRDGTYTGADELIQPLYASDLAPLFSRLTGLDTHL